MTCSCVHHALLLMLTPTTTNSHTLTHTTALMLDQTPVGEVEVHFNFHLSTDCKLGVCIERDTPCRVTCLPSYCAFCQTLSPSLTHQTLALGHPPCLPCLPCPCMLPIQPPGPLLPGQCPWQVGQPRPTPETVNPCKRRAAGAAGQRARRGARN